MPVIRAALPLLRAGLMASFALLLFACARQVPAAVEAGAPGFLLGLVHGYIIVFSFIGSLFSDTIAVYAVPNNGGWYDFGFALGAGAFGGSAAASRR